MSQASNCSPMPRRRNVMKKRILLASITAGVVLVGAGVGYRAFAGDRGVALRAELRGLNEVPPTTSRGSASLRATLAEDAPKISFTIAFPALAATTPARA